MNAFGQLLSSTRRWASASVRCRSAATSARVIHLVCDITRAVKEGQKSIALNEVRDMARRLGLLADAFDPKSADPKSAPEKADALDGAQAA